MIRAEPQNGYLLRNFSWIERYPQSAPTTAPMRRSLPAWLALIVVGLGLLVMAITLPLTGHVPTGGVVLLYGTAFVVMIVGLSKRVRAV